MAYSSWATIAKAYSLQDWATIEQFANSECEHEQAAYKHAKRLIGEADLAIAQQMLEAEFELSEQDKQGTGDLYHLYASSGPRQAIRSIAKLSGYKIPVEKHCADLDYHGIICHCWWHMQRAQGLSFKQIDALAEQVEYPEKAEFVLRKAYWAQQA